jgi:hypothetical protein
VSALCSTVGIAVVNADSSRHLPSITARPTPAEKQRFAELAAVRGLSESALALIAIRALLESNTAAPAAGTQPPATREPAADRITIRLRPGDRHNIGDRAARRGMKTSAYLAALVRAHIAANPPVPAAELSELKTIVAVLAALSGVLARLDRRVKETGEGARELETNLYKTRVAVMALEQVTSEFARAALVSWETLYD